MLKKMCQNIGSLIVSFTSASVTFFMFVSGFLWSPGACSGVSCGSRELIVLFSGDWNLTDRAVLVGQGLVGLGVRFYDKQDPESAQDEANGREHPDEVRSPVCDFLGKHFGAIHFYHVDILRIDKSVRHE
jgi:hypothetical protein